VAEDELWKTFLRFEREVVKPRMETLRDDLRGDMRSLRNEMFDGFDGVYHRMERVETELAAITAALKRLETDVARLKAGEHLDRDTLRAEVAEIKQRLSVVEKSLN